MRHEYFVFNLGQGPSNLAMNIHIKHNESGAYENIDLPSSSMANQKKEIPNCGSSCLIYCWNVRDVCLETIHFAKRLGDTWNHWECAGGSSEESIPSLSIGEDIKYDYDDGGDNKNIFNQYSIINCQPLYDGSFLPKLKKTTAKIIDIKAK